MLIAILKDNYYDDDDYIPPHRRDHSTPTYIPSGGSENSTFQGQGHTLAPRPSVPVDESSRWIDDAMDMNDFLSDDEEFGSAGSEDEFITEIKKKKASKVKPKETQSHSSPSQVEVEDVDARSAKNRKRRSEDVDSDSDGAYSSTKKTKRIVQTRS